MADEERPEETEETMEIRVSVEPDPEFMGRWTDTLVEYDKGIPVPAELWNSLQAARHAVEAADKAVKDYLIANHPDVPWVADWINNARHAAAREAYARDHPNGPDWMSYAADAGRKWYLDAHGYER